MWRCHQLLSRFISANDKGDNEVKPGAEDRSPGVYLIAEETPKTPARRSSDESCATSHPFKWDPFSQNDVGRIAQHFRERNGSKEGKKQGSKEAC